MSHHYVNVLQQQIQVSLSDSLFSCIEILDNTEYLWILYQTCFQSARLNVQVPAITIPPFEPVTPWTFTPPPDGQVWELVVFCILYSINIIKNCLLYLSQSNQCVVSHSIGHYRSTWCTGGLVENSFNLSKGSSTILWTVVDITQTTLRLREMRKSW
jgi:hypothetical protein